MTATVLQVHPSCVQPQCPASQFGIGFYDTAGDALEAEAHLAEIYVRGRSELPEDLRNAVDVQPESQGPL